MPGEWKSSTLALQIKVSGIHSISTVKSLIYHSVLLDNGWLACHFRNKIDTQLQIQIDNGSRVFFIFFCSAFRWKPVNSEVVKCFESKQRLKIQKMVRDERWAETWFAASVANICSVDIDRKFLQGKNALLNMISQVFIQKTVIVTTIKNGL